MNKLNKIVFTLPTLTAGGMERFTSELANYFAKYDEVDVYIVLYGKYIKPHYNTDSRIRIIEPDFDYNEKAKAIEGLKRAIWLRKTIRKINPDTVMSVGTSWNKFVLLSLLGTKYNVFVSDRGNPFKKQSRVYRILEKLLYPGAAGIVAQTNTARDIYRKKKLNDNIVVLLNPIREIDNADQVRSKTIVSVGRLIETKHFDRLIHIFSKIENKEWKLIIIGGESLNQRNMFKLQSLSKELNISDRVIFTGAITNVDDYLTQASIFAFTSSSEGFPNALAEAMSAGLPAISYDCPTGPSDIIVDGENGFLIPLFDDDAFVDRLNILIDNEDLRNKMGTTAKEKSREFTTEVIGRKFFELFLRSI